MASSSTSSQVQPARNRGFGREKGVFGGISGRQFALICPPDVGKNTRIIGLCGAAGSDLSPEEDGWFASDLFLFYQMLRDRSDFPHQLWFVSHSPRELVEKYGRYVHGPSHGNTLDRRVVMDAALLPSSEYQDGFRAIGGKDLLSRFLSGLEEEVQSARKYQKENPGQKQPVMIFIFGHGDFDSHGIFVGTRDRGAKSMLLTVSHLKSVMSVDIQTTVVITSCYPGGWIMKPNFEEELFHEKPALDFSILTAAGYENMSIAWDASRSKGRQAGGSVFATCLLQSIIIAHEDNRLVRVEEDDVGNILLYTDTMAQISEDIMKECKARFSGGMFEDHHKFSCSTEDDLWGQAFTDRTGLPLTQWAERWRGLPEAPPGKEVHEESESLTGSLSSRPLGHLRNLVMVKAQRYMSSKPGLDNAGCNTDTHPRFKRLIAGSTEFDLDDLAWLDAVLDYRLYQQERAEVLCDELGISAGDSIDNFDYWEWTVDRRNTDFKPSACRVHGWLLQYRLFDSPIGNQGLHYEKPLRFLAARCAESKVSLDDLETKIQTLSQAKFRAMKAAADSSIGRAILGKPEIRTARGVLYKTVSRLEVRARSLSPRKNVTRG